MFLDAYVFFIDKGSFLSTSRIANLGKPSSKLFSKSLSLQVEPLPAFINIVFFERLLKKS